MTGNSYRIAKILATLGFPRKTKRLTDAAGEAHLLTQAEGLLGLDIWEACESVEELSVEYWTLRKLNQKKEDLQSRLIEAKKNLDIYSERHVDTLNENSGEDTAREEERAELVVDLQKLNVKRAEVISSAYLVRRKIESARAKIEVLAEHFQEGDKIESEKIALAENTAAFDDLKIERDKVSSEISVISERIELLESEIARGRSSLKDRASGIFQDIGEANREASSLALEIGLLDVEMQDYYMKVGRHFRGNIKGDSVCSKIAQKHKLIISQMKALEQSISLNHKIARTRSSN